MFLQLGKEGMIIVLYFNFRPSADTKNYPPRDDFIADFLGNGSSLPRPGYEERCHWFFGATFKVLSLTLSSSVEATAGVYEDAVQHWNEHYGVGGTERATFLSSIEKNIRVRKHSAAFCVFAFLTFVLVIGATDSRSNAI